MSDEQLSMESESWWGTPDPKEGPRIKASRKDWQGLQEAKRGPCRICGQSQFIGGSGLHHLVARSLGGDDTEDNLVPLCGSGTTGCHGLIEARDPQACTTLRKNLTLDESDYVARKKGWDWLNRRYPPGEAPLVGLSEGGGARQAGIEPAQAEPYGHRAEETEGPGRPNVAAKPPSESLSAGTDCPTCLRRIPHPKKASTPKSTPISYRTPDEARGPHKETLEAAARHIGIYEKPFWMFQLSNIGAVLILQGRADLLD